MGWANAVGPTSIEGSFFLVSPQTGIQHFHLNALVLVIYLVSQVRQGYTTGPMLAFAVHR